MYRPIQGVNLVDRIADVLHRPAQQGGARFGYGFSYRYRLPDCLPFKFL